jgi:hypothetical protein
VARPVLPAAFFEAAPRFAVLGYLLAQNVAPRPAVASPPPRIATRIGLGERQDRETDDSGTISLSQDRSAS